ncbi:MAG TPA: carboxypeptidase-like regulatory domain-containing protein [Candidatus Cybelea sp.]|nr:carboxypeptidase-like regulatory domain-containing protein [Candidatus Cybelea sp.]
MHIVLMLILSHFFFWSTAIDWQMNQSDAKLWGTVVDDASGAAVPGAVVYAVSGPDVKKAVSDANGHFIFLTLLPGTYRLCASKPGDAVDCRPRESQPQELYAGFEYGATVVLSQRQ